MASELELKVLNVLCNDYLFGAEGRKNFPEISNELFRNNCEAAVDDMRELAAKIRNIWINFEEKEFWRRAFNVPEFKMMKVAVEWVDLRTFQPITYGVLNEAELAEYILFMESRCFDDVLHDLREHGHTSYAKGGYVLAMDLVPTRPPD